MIVMADKMMKEKNLFKRQKIRKEKKLKPVTRFPAAQVAYGWAGALMPKSPINVMRAKY